MRDAYTVEKGGDKGVESMNDVAETLCDRCCTRLLNTVVVLDIVSGRKCNRDDLLYRTVKTANRIEARKRKRRKGKKGGNGKTKIGYKGMKRNETNDRKQKRGECTKGRRKEEGTGI